MFLQNLLKKISEIIKDIEQQLHDNYIEIIRNILIIGGVVIFFIVILVVLIARISAPPVVKKQEKVTVSKYKENFSKVKLFVSDEFEYPDIRLFDLTNDYVDFIPTKKYNVPNFKQSIKDYNVILEDSIKESLKFNFEK